MSKKFNTASECIYCETRGTPRTEEHIIPLSINGDLVIPKAVCKKCQEITNEEIENILLSQCMKLLRVKMGFKSRGKKRGKNHKEVVSFIATNTLTNEKILIPINEYPFFQIPVFPPPSIISENYYKKNSCDYIRMHIVNILHPTDAKAKTYYIDQKWQIGVLERQLAKIAHAYSYAYNLFENFTPLLNEIILGESENIWSFVGNCEKIGDEYKILAQDISTHYEIRMSSEIHNHSLLLICRVKLFSNISSPEYIIVTGALNGTPKQNSILVSNHLKQNQLHWLISNKDRDINNQRL